MPEWAEWFVWTARAEPFRLNQSMTLLAAELEALLRCCVIIASAGRLSV